MYILSPILKPAIWGGDQICALKGDEAACADIGESWELSAMPGMECTVAIGPERGLTLRELIAKHGAALVGARLYGLCGEDFPLLVKIIDARSDLSVQVHPDDNLAREVHGTHGKTEMWYVASARPGARIYCGMSRAITPSQYERMVSDKTIMQALATYESQAGDVYFVPPGRIHAIGAGNILVEVQQACDITYRVYDYDRTDADGHRRELHTELAERAIDYRVLPDYRTAYDRTAPVAEVARCEHFTVSRMLLGAEPRPVPGREGECAVVVSLEGGCRISAGDDTITIPPFHTALLPAEAPQATISGSGTAIVAIP